MDHISIGLWATNLEYPAADLSSWLARLERRLAEAVTKDVQLLVMPEYACAQWLHFAPAGLPPAARLGWLAGISALALPEIAALSRRHLVSLVPGTFPHHSGERGGERCYANRAWLLTSGGAFYQDKLALTPLEERSVFGVTRAGDAVQIITWMGLRVAIIVGLDVEYTRLWSKLGRLNLDLILVPAKTDLMSGYHRVLGCARARAIELQTAVCVVGAVGQPFGNPWTDPGVGGAAAYLPCDVSTRRDGLGAIMPAHEAASGLDPVLWILDLPVGACRRMREGHADAEVCPASWKADHLIIREADYHAVAKATTGVLAPS